MEELIFTYLNWATRGGVFYKDPTVICYYINPETNEWYFDIDKGGNAWFSSKIERELRSLFPIWVLDLNKIIEEWISSFGFTINGVHLNIPPVGLVDNILKTGERINKLNESINSNNGIEEVLFKYLDHISEGCKLFGYDNEVWYINPENKKWMFYQSDGNLICVFNEFIFKTLEQHFDVGKYITLEIINKWCVEILGRETEGFEVDGEIYSVVLNHVIDNGVLLKNHNTKLVTENIKKPMEGEQKLIDYYLNHVLDGSKIYNLGGSDWIVDPEKNKWYVEFTQHDHVYINRQLTNDIVNIFGFTDLKVLYLLKKWIFGFFGRKPKNIYNNLKRPFPDVVMRHGMKIGSFEDSVGNINEHLGGNSGLNDIIFQYLNHITEGANVYHMDNGSDWIINPEKKYWYAELEKSGKCWLRYRVLDEISMMFAIQDTDVQKIMGQWVEEVIKRGVVTTIRKGMPSFFTVEEVIKRGVVTTRIHLQRRYTPVEEVIKRGVVTTVYNDSRAQWMVEEVIKLGEKIKTLGQQNQITEDIDFIDWGRYDKIQHVLNQNREIKSLNNNKLQEMKDTIKKAIDSEFTQAASGMNSDSFLEMQKKSNDLQGQLEGETTEATSAGSAGGYSTPLTKMETKEEKIKGGLADKKSFNDLVKKHIKVKNIETIIKDQLRKGIKVEMEHTDDKKIAKEIAMDHLFEDPKYYDKLKKVETKEATSSSSSGQYSGPAFLAKSMKKKDWRGASRPQIPGGKFVEVKKKCKTFPYCNQGDVKALKIFENEILSKIITKISKEHNISETVIRNIIVEELRRNR